MSYSLLKFSNKFYKVLGGNNVSGASCSPDCRLSTMANVLLLCKLNNEFDYFDSRNVQLYLNVSNYNKGVFDWILSWLRFQFLNMFLGTTITKKIFKNGLRFILINFWADYLWVNSKENDISSSITIATTGWRSKPQRKLKFKYLKILKTQITKFNTNHFYNRGREPASSTVLFSAPYSFDFL